MRQYNWTELKVNTTYLLIDNEYIMNKKIGIFQDYIGHGSALRFNHVIHLLFVNILDPEHKNRLKHEYHICGLFYTFYDLTLYLKEIREYTPKKIPSLHSLVKYQLSTEEIRIAREYDGVF